MRARIYSPVGRLPVDHEFAEGTTLGRGPDNALVLESPLLSSFHARITWDAELECYRLEDMGSTNGTRLDGARVKAPLPLGHLHVITLADRYEFVFLDLERCAARHLAEPDAVKSVAPAGAVSEKTSIGALSLALPDLLRGADAQESPAPRGVPEGTLLEKLPLPLPGFLRRTETESGPTDDASLAAKDAAPRHAPTESEAPASEVDRDAGARSRKAKPPAPTIDLPPKIDWRNIETGSKPLPQPPTGPEQAQVFFLSAQGPSGTLHFPLGVGENRIGRSQDCQVRIDSPEVSRHHALLKLEAGRLRIRDLGSRNKTYVDGNAIGPKDVDLLPGQRLRFGRLEVEVGVRSTAPGTRKEG